MSAKNLLKNIHLEGQWDGQFNIIHFPRNCITDAIFINKVLHYVYICCWLLLWHVSTTVLGNIQGASNKLIINIVNEVGHIDVDISQMGYEDDWSVFSGNYSVFTLVINGQRQGLRAPSRYLIVTRISRTFTSFYAVLTSVYAYFVQLFQEDSSGLHAK